MIEKQFSSSSVVVLLEKVIRKNSEMLRYKTSMRKSFFSKATCSSTKKEFLHVLFFLKILKNFQEKKQKLSEKLLTGLVLMNIFTYAF